MTYTILSGPTTKKKTFFMCVFPYGERKKYSTFLRTCPLSSDPPPSAPLGDKKLEVDFFRLFYTYTYQSNRNALKWTILKKKKLAVIDLPDATQILFILYLFLW